MAALRSAEAVRWPSGTAAVASGDASLEVLVGPTTAVSVYIRNSGGVAATFKVQAGATVPLGAGRNTVPGVNDWYDYTGATAITVAGGATVCFDLTPFGPPFLRLVRTDAGASTTIAAIATGLPGS